MTPEKMPELPDDLIRAITEYSPSYDEGMRMAGLIRAYGELCRQGEAKDAARYRFLRDSQNCSLSINHNGHHNMYETLEQVFEHHGGDPKSDYYGDIPPDERAAMIATDSLWTLHIYPNTPVGFNVYHGATLDAAIDAAMQADTARTKEARDEG